MTEKDIRDASTEELLQFIALCSSELSRRWNGTPLMYEANKIWRKQDEIRLARTPLDKIKARASPKGNKEP